MPALRAQYRRELDGAILVSPPVEIDAPTLSEIKSSPEAEDAINARALRLTMPLSYLNSPSAVIPVHSPNALPAPLQLSAAPDQDHQVLTATTHLSTVTP